MGEKTTSTTTHLMITIIPDACWDTIVKLQTTAVVVRSRSITQLPETTQKSVSHKARSHARDRKQGSIESDEHDSTFKHGSIEPDEHGSTFKHGSIEPDEHDSIEPVRSIGQQGHGEAEERHGRNGENDRDSAHNPVDGGSKTDGPSSSRHSRSSDHAKKAQRDSRSLAKLDSPAQRLKRRSVPKQARIGHAHAHEEGGHFHEPHETDEKCLSPKEILNDFSITSEALISERQFLHICPLLITQIDSRACIQHSNNTHAVRTTESLGSGPGAVWGWASLAITVISLVSLLAVAMVPLTTRSFYTYLITFLVALAVGCLSGDAVLHLIPHALGIHGDHDEADQGHVTEEDPQSSVWKGCVVLVGIFSFFILEKTIGVVTSARSKRKDRLHLRNSFLRNREDFVGYKLSTTFSDEPEIELSLMDEGVQSRENDQQSHSGQSQRHGGHSHSHQGHSYSHQGHSHSHQGHSHSHQGHSHSHQGHSHSHGGHSHSHGGHLNDRNAGIASVAWMVIMGDGLHNFADGVTIGAAFAASLTAGLSTSIAVFCHELPHELGDFAILLKAGMSFKHAITYNLVSGIISFVGMAVGVGMGKSNQVGPWVFALAGGMFLYIALVDMLPELLHGSAAEDRSDTDDQKKKKTANSTVVHVLVQSAGMLTGVVIMLLIAIFEDDLEKVLGQ
ncbi:zinc transporter ZIP10-like isoform X2 [Branchiostoma floridae x Branchiostoma belcheri]